MEPFKNMLGYEASKKIARAIKQTNPQFSDKDFLRNLKSELDPLELKQRMILIKERLSYQMDPHPKSFPHLVDSLKKSDQDKIGLSGFLVWPLTQFVADFGINDFDKSMKALKEMTKVFTAEFAVRPFFLKDQDYMLKIFMDWTGDSNEHVRRLVSEGSRPLLPWGQKLPMFLDDPNLTWPLLEKLKNDSAKYVQKSVANHMNDISKKHGDWLVKQLSDWPNPWVSKHAIRTLVKKGHPGALKILGVETILPTIKSLKLKSSKIKLGQKLEGVIEIENKRNKPLKTVIDIEIYFLKANGKHAVKVFKGKTIDLKPNQKEKIIINTPIKKVTTRTYHYGIQYWSVIINGHRQKKIKFILSK